MGRVIRAQLPQPRLRREKLDTSRAS
ncbi:BnaA06g25410D [Brassica napus]|uniref:BnaA06g25410D protein n=1 Tax=Brassica napus TaxID=3708 RepID=A0A078GUJ5_BRANA|nr:BnaA06g25410D [Brassica napus]